MSDGAGPISASLMAHFTGSSLWHDYNTLAFTRWYTRFDLSVGYRFGNRADPLTISLSTTNLLNDGHYETAPGGLGRTNGMLPQGRTVWVSLRHAL